MKSHFKIRNLFIFSLLCAFGYNCTTTTFADDTIPPPDPNAAATPGGTVPPADTNQPSDTNLPGPYTLTYKFTAGEVQTYVTSLDIIEQMTAGMIATPMNIHIDMTTTRTCESVRAEDGAATERIQLVSSNGTMNGQPLSAKLIKQYIPGSTTVIVSPTGKVLAASLKAGQPPVAGAQDTNSFGQFILLPSNPITTGEVWTDSAPLAGLGLTIASQVSLKSVDSANNARVAQLESKYSSTQQQYSQQQYSQQQQGQASTPGVVMSGDFLTNFDITAGEIKSEIGRMTTTISGPSANGQGENALQLEMRTRVTLQQPVAP